MMGRKAPVRAKDILFAPRHNKYFGFDCLKSERVRFSLGVRGLSEDNRCTR